MNKVDFKKVYKDLYLPKNEPSIITVPAMTFIMVDGKGNPNEPNGEYKQAVELLYALSYTIKMSKMGGFTPEGYYDYVVPPLEGLWWLSDSSSRNFYANKEEYHWTSMIRQPEFVTQEVFSWAQAAVIDKRKKEAFSSISKVKHISDTDINKKTNIDITKVRLETFAEGLCVQMMHFGPYDTEPESINRIDAYIHDNNLMNDIGNPTSDEIVRRHHEIYLNDPRKVKPESLKTILRHPVRKMN